jgi:hypothetical protein
MTPEDGDEPHIETNMRHGAISEGEKIKTEMMDATLSAQHSGRANEVIFASGRQEELEEVQSGQEVSKRATITNQKSMPISKEMKEQLSMGVEAATPVNRSVQKKVADSNMALDQHK